MKKTTLLKVLLSLTITLLSGFFVSEKAKATSPYDQTDSSGGTTISGSSALDTANGITIHFYTATGTNFTLNSFAISAVSADLNANCTGLQTELTIFKDAGTWQTIATSTISVIPVGNELFWDFTSNPVNINGTSFYFQIAPKNNCSNGQSWKNNTPAGWVGLAYTNNAPASTYWWGYPAWDFGTKVPIIEINGSIPKTFDIAFHPSDFSDNMITQDFRSWELDLTAPANSIDTFKVQYKNASSTDWQYTDTYILSGHTNPGILASTTFPLVKTVNLAPGGNYEAMATLDNEWQGGNGLPATSTILHFTIATGTPILHPGTQTQPNGGLPPSQLWDSSWCPDTSFAVLGADFGKGVCTIFAFLFVPGSDLLDKFNNTLNLISTKIPFSYVSEIKDIITNAGTGTGQSMPTISIKTSASSSIPNLNIPIFSSSTIASSTAISGFSTLRGLANVLLYIGFGMMCWYTAVGLAHKGKQ